MRKTSDFNSGAARKPSAHEVEQISKYVREYSSSKIKISKRMSSILTVVGLVLVGAIGGGVNKASLFSAILGCLCFLLVFKFIQSKNGCIAEINAYSTGAFAVIDGRICKMEVNADTPGFCNAWFVSNDEAINDGWFQIRQEDVSIGSPMMLAVANNRRDTKNSVFAFSEFMLTDEGIRLHL